MVRRRCYGHRLNRHHLKAETFHGRGLRLCPYGGSLGAGRRSSNNVLALHLPISCVYRLKVLPGGRLLVHGLSARW
jgi:hypothetical protein